MEEIKKVIDRLKKAAELCMSSLGCNTCLECEYKSRCVTDKNADIIRVMEWAEKKLESTDGVEKNEAVKHQSVGGIKGERDEALMNLYRHFNALTGEKFIVGKLGPMHEVLNAIEKLEHARHMEASDEIAKMSIEKLEKFERPMQVVKMGLKEYEAIRNGITERKVKKNDD